LQGLELHGHHGVLEEERTAGQRFLFDIELDVPGRAAETDRIEDAVDYRDVAAAVRATSEERRCRLLESLAVRVADGLLESFPAERVRVRVRKPDVRLGVPVEFAAVSVERARGHDPS
jgi:dihydroneopterin aldolase